MAPTTPRTIPLFLFEAGGTLLGADPREIRRIGSTASSPAAVSLSRLLGGGGPPEASASDRRVLELEASIGGRSVQVDRIRGVEMLEVQALHPLPEWAEPLRPRGIIGAALPQADRPLDERPVVLLVSLRRLMESLDHAGREGPSRGGGPGGQEA